MSSHAYSWRFISSTDHLMKHVIIHNKLCKQCITTDTARLCACMLGIPKPIHTSCSCAFLQNAWSSQVEKTWKQKKSPETNAFFWHLTPGGSSETCFLWGMSQESFWDLLKFFLQKHKIRSADLTDFFDFSYTRLTQKLYGLFLRFFFFFVYTAAS